MTYQRNETPEPLAGPSVESCATALAEALRREKGWLLDYGHSVIRDAIDRKHLEPLAQKQAGELPKAKHYVFKQLHDDSFGKGWETHYGTCVPPWRTTQSAEPLYTAEQMREYRSAALQAKDAEIAGLKADAGRYRWLREQAEPNRGGEKPWCTVRDKRGYAWTLGAVLDEAIDFAMKGEAA